MLNPEKRFALYGGVCELCNNSDNIEPNLREVGFKYTSTIHIQ